MRWCREDRWTWWGITSKSRGELEQRERKSPLKEKSGKYESGSAASNGPLSTYGL
jgi:hypothetical protein